MNTTRNLYQSIIKQVTASASLIGVFILATGCIDNGNQTLYDQIYCPTDADPSRSAYGARYPFGTSEQNAFWGSLVDDGMTGRLNLIGVWSCPKYTQDPQTTPAVSAPANVWISSGHCVTVDQGGDYLIGVGVDNQARVYIDGELVYENLATNTSPFIRWWLTPLQLNPGIVYVEVEALNLGSLGSFGTEIYGPWDYNSFYYDTDDTNMINLGIDATTNTIFSSLQMIGQPFVLDDAPGVSNYSIDKCM